MQPIQLPGNAVGVAVDVGPHLEHRHTSVASGQLHVIGLRHHHGGLHRSPREPLQAQAQPDLLGVGRHVVVVEDEFGQWH